MIAGSMPVDAPKHSWLAGCPSYSGSPPDFLLRDLWNTLEATQYVQRGKDFEWKLV